MADTAAPLIRNPWFTILMNPRLRSSRRTCAPIGNSVRRRRRLCLSFSELLISSSVKRPRNAARLGGRADNREAVDEAIGQTRCRNTDRVAVNHEPRLPNLPFGNVGLEVKTASRFRI